MTPEEAIKALDSILELMKTVQKEQLVGEEVVPFVMGVQMRVKDLKEYVNEHKTLTIDG